MKEVISNLQKFEERWKDKCDEIKKCSFTNDQCFNIYHGFIEERIRLTMYSKPNEVPFKLLDEIGNDLDLSLEIARSNYRKENKGFWSKIFNFKNIRK